LVGPVNWYDQIPAELLDSERVKEPVEVVPRYVLVMVALWASVIQR
jgi:hypothetical protein